MVRCLTVETDSEGKTQNLSGYTAMIAQRHFIYITLSTSQRCPEQTEQKFEVNRKNADAGAGSVQASRCTMAADIMLGGAC